MWVACCRVAKARESISKSGSRDECGRRCTYSVMTGAPTVFTKCMNSCRRNTISSKDGILARRYKLVSTRRRAGKNNIIFVSQTSKLRSLNSALPDTPPELLSHHLPCPLPHQYPHAPHLPLSQRLTSTLSPSSNLPSLQSSKSTSSPPLPQLKSSIPTPRSLFPKIYL